MYNMTNQFHVHFDIEIREALLMQTNRASTLSAEIVKNIAQIFDGLHLKMPAACE